MSAFGLAFLRFRRDAGCYGSLAHLVLSGRYHDEFTRSVKVVAK